MTFGGNKIHPAEMHPVLQEHRDFFFHAENHRA
jgi:hypothetical protein